MVTVEQAKNLRNGIDISATITGFGESRSVNKKDGTTISVRDAKLKDNTGEINLTLWGDDCTKFAENQIVQLKNGYSNTFKGEVSLTKGKYGSLEKVA